MIFPPLMKKIVQNLFEHRVFNSNVNNNTKTNDIKYIFNKYIIFSELIQKTDNFNEETTNELFGKLFANVHLNEVKYNKENNVKREITRRFPQLTFKLYNDCQRGGERVIHTGSKGGKYYMKGGRKVYI